MKLRLSTIQQTLLALCLQVLLGGCSLWSGQPERTSIITPRMRMAAIREMGAKAPDSDATQQAEYCQKLAQQIQTETDPLVRQEIQNTVAKFSDPLAQRMLIAGLQDEDSDVRLTCCYRLADRAEAATIAPLRQAMQGDSELDVRLAALDALAKIGTDETIEAFGVALADRDPAMQYAAIVALKETTGKNLGNDVVIWQQYLQGQSVEQPEISVAERIRQVSPF